MTDTLHRKRRRGGSLKRQPKQALANAEAALRIYEEIESPYAERVRRQLAEWRAAAP